MNTNIKYQTTQLILIAQILIILMLVTVAFNVPVARQLLGFICITFIPGFLIYKILKCNWDSLVEAILFSVVLSISFVMFLGLFVNTSYYTFGILKPLSTQVLTITIGAFLTAMCFIAYYVGESRFIAISLPSLKDALLASLLIVIPILAIYGAYYNNSMILLIMIVAISALLILVTISNNVIPDKLYIVVLYIIAISLLLHVALSSQHIMGWDVFTEYFVFISTKSNFLWNPFLNISVTYTDILNYDAMLSVTILPTIYSSLLNLQEELIFRILYYLLYSIVPLLLYQAYNKRYDKLTAFLAVFYFIAFPRFYSEERRQMICEIFYASLICLIMAKDISPRKTTLLSIIFAASLIVSHYSVSYIFLFSILFVYATIFIIKRIGWKVGRMKVLTGGFVIFVSIMTYIWYAIVSIEPYNKLMDFTNFITNTFSVDFLNLGSRGELKSWVAPAVSSTFVQNMDSAINKIPYVFIIIGLFMFFRGYKDRDFNWEYALMVAANGFILFISIVVPNFNPAFLVTRFYHVALMFLAPLCIEGGEKSIRFAVKFISAKNANRWGLILVSVIFVVIFLFKVGFVTEVSKDLIVVYRPVNFLRMETSNDLRTRTLFYESYVPEQEIYSTIWLSGLKGDNYSIYVDYVAFQHIFRSYGMTILGWDSILSNNTKIVKDGYIYMRTINHDGMIEDESGFYNIAVNQISNKMNKLYSNGGSDIYQSISIRFHLVITDI